MNVAKGLQNASAAQSGHVPLLSLSLLPDGDFRVDFSNGRTECPGLYLKPNHWERTPRMSKPLIGKNVFLRIEGDIIISDLIRYQVSDEELNHFPKRWSRWTIVIDFIR